MKKNKLIRNSTAEFLIFTTQDAENTIEVRYEDETIWLTQKMMAELFEVDIPLLARICNPCQLNKIKAQKIV